MIYYKHIIVQSDEINPFGGQKMSKWLSFLNNNQKVVEKPILENIPEHIAIIMDGNGRWASKKGLPRVAGHKEGMTVVQKIVRAAVAYDVKILTLYAFS